MESLPALYMEFGDDTMPYGHEVGVLLRQTEIVWLNYFQYEVVVSIEEWKENILTSGY